MPAYVVIRIKADDPSLLKDYQKVAPSIIEKYSEKFLARGASGYARGAGRNTSHHHY